MILSGVKTGFSYAKLRLLVLPQSHWFASALALQMFRYWHSRLATKHALYSILDKQNKNKCLQLIN
jgi:hypothetical protein